MDVLHALVHNCYGSVLVENSASNGDELTIKRRHVRRDPPIVCPSPNFVQDSNKSSPRILSKETFLCAHTVSVGRKFNLKRFIRLVFRHATTIVHYRRLNSKHLQSNSLVYNIFKNMSK